MAKSFKKEYEFFEQDEIYLLEKEIEKFAKKKKNNYLKIAKKEYEDSIQNLRNFQYSTNGRYSFDAEEKHGIILRLAKVFDVIFVDFAIPSFFVFLQILNLSAVKVEYGALDTLISISYFLAPWAFLVFASIFYRTKEYIVGGYKDLDACLASVFYFFFFPLHNSIKKILENKETKKKNKYLASIESEKKILEKRVYKLRTIVNDIENEEFQFEFVYGSFSEIGFKEFVSKI